jgi:glycosyltransferase involved in cell wall biosynthesis
MWLSLLFGGTAAVFLAMTLAAACLLRWTRRLVSLNEFTVGDAGSDLPRCSVVVAARDEEARIENTVRHLLSQVRVTVEVIVVDDRSTDRTDEILRRLATEEARVVVRRVDALPAGWLGKCHACHVGASVATGDWILFTDADCWSKPDVIARALQVADREGADHIVLTPGIAQPTLGARAWHLAFLVSLANWFSGVNRDRPKAYLGMGAFNLALRGIELGLGDPSSGRYPVARHLLSIGYLARGDSAVNYGDAVWRGAHAGRWSFGGEAGAQNSFDAGRRWRRIAAQPTSVHYEMRI